MKNRVIQLDAKDTKDNETRNIPILKAIPRSIHDDHVFLYKGKPVEDIRGALRIACKNAGISYCRFVKGGFIFHDLRHSFNTHMRKAGIQESVIMTITGHSTREMFNRYNMVDEEETRKAIYQLQGYFQTGCCPNLFFMIVFPEVTNFMPILNIINKITIFNNNIK